MSDIRAIPRRSGEIRIPPRLMNYVMIPYTGHNSSIPWMEHEINTLLQKLDWWQKKKNMKKEDKQYSSQFLFFRDDDASEAEVVTDIKKPRKVNYQIR